MNLFRISGLLLLGMLTARSETWSLEDALRYARTNSPDARIAQHRIGAAQAMLGQANAAFWPKLQASSSYARTDHPVSVFGAALNQRSYSPALDFNRVPDADNLNARGSLNIPIYAGGRNVSARKAARAGLAASRSEAQAVAHTLEFEVARAFYSIHKTRRFIEAAESAVRSYELNRGLAEKRLNAGAALKTELLDLEVRLGEAREELVRARNASALALTALKQLLGVEDNTLAVAADPVQIELPDSASSQGRPELLALSFQEESAAANLRRAKAGRLPQVDAFGHLDHDRGWKFDGSGSSYAVGVVATWDIWDGQLTRNRVREAESSLELVREQERKLRLQIDYEVEEAKLLLDEAGQRLLVTRQTIAQAEESVALTRARYEQGLALSTQLIDAETALTAARVRHAEAEADRSIAVAALRKAQGLSQLEGIEP
jgi:outer membrane protein TolC